MKIKDNALSIITFGSLTFLIIFGWVAAFYGSIVLGVKADCESFDFACPINALGKTVTATLRLLPEWSLWSLFIIPFSLFWLGGLIYTFQEGRPVKLTPEEAKELHDLISDAKPRTEE